MSLLDEVVQVVLGDHATVAHKHDPPEGETLPQITNHLLNGGMIHAVARPHVMRDRPAPSTPRSFTACAAAAVFVRFFPSIPSGSWRVQRTRTPLFCPGRRRSPGRGVGRGRSLPCWATPAPQGLADRTHPPIAGASRPGGFSEHTRRAIQPVRQSPRQTGYPPP